MGPSFDALLHSGTFHYHPNAQGLLTNRENGQPDINPSHTEPSSGKDLTDVGFFSVPTGSFAYPGS